MVSHYSVIEYGYNSKDNIKYKKWVEKFVINDYDELVGIYQGLNTFKFKNKVITKSVLNGIIYNTNKSIYKDESLANIIYKIRCSETHTGERTLIEFPRNINRVLNTNSTKIEFLLDEDNVFSYDNSKINICPKFFSSLILYSIKEYVNKISKNMQSDQYNRYQKYLNNNVSLIASTIKSKDVNYNAKACVSLVSLACVSKDIDLVICDNSFKWSRIDCEIEVLYSQIKGIVLDNENKSITINFTENISNFFGVDIDLENPKIEDLLKKVNID